jgi:SecD/SecF fusion protein
MPRATFSQIVNRSMSEVMTRSLATSFCTLLPVAALLFFGGETLKDFAFALLVGIASGTYSSIFIASPVLTAWKEREAVYVQRRRRVMENFGLVPAFAVATTAGVPATPVMGSGGRPEPAPVTDGGAPVDEEWEPEEDEGEDEFPAEDVEEDEDVPAAVSEDGHTAAVEDGAQAAQQPAKAAPKKSSRQRRRKHGRGRR